MLLLSFGLHLAIVLIFALGLLPQARQPLRPVYEVDLVNLPAAELQTNPPEILPELVAPVVKPQPEPEPAPLPPEVEPAPTPVRAAPLPPKPEPAPPKEVPLPRPAPRPYAERPAENRQSLPERRARMGSGTEAELPVQPSLPAYDRAAPRATAAPLPQETARLQTASREVAVADPTLRRIQERQSTDAGLPARGSVALNGSPGAEVAGVDPAVRTVRERKATSDKLSPATAVDLARAEVSDLTPLAARGAPQRYETRDAIPAAPEPVRRGAVSPLPAAEAAIGPPTAVASRSGRLEGRRTAEGALSPSAARTVLSGPASPEVSLQAPAVAARSERPAKVASAQPPSDPSAFDFLDLKAPEELDQSTLVNLSRLRTCRDPDAEMRLKTRLAVLLSRPTVCRSGGVVFDLRNVESAYSVHMEIYNYEQREFQDRCAALRLAVECSERLRR